MASIADSDAVLSKERVLPQHQAALTLLQARLAEPGRGRVRWLDLACGRGQMIASLDTNLSPDGRANLEYCGVEIDQHFARETSKIAQGLALAAADVKVGDLQDFDKLLPPDDRFDFITFTNTVHEVAPGRLAAILVDALQRLTAAGTLFVYDTERLGSPELGAVPWQADEVRGIVRAILDGLGATAYRPEVGRWQHTTVAAWNVQLNRQHFGVSAADLLARREGAIEQTSRAIVELLRKKMDLCRNALDSLTRYGAETADEQKEKTRLLYEFWAVHRAMENRQ